jgi:O-antigen/teichoic acid export membrane protein
VTGPTSAEGGSGDHQGQGPAPPLDLMLEEMDLAMEPVTESSSFAPSAGIATAGGSMIPLPPDPDHHPPAGRESFRSGFSQAGPVAVAGLVVNGASALVVVVVAHLVSPRAYGAIAQLLGLFFILSMPGSAVLVGVVRRVTALQALGHPERVHRWARKVHRILLSVVVVELVVVWLLQGWIARELSLPNSQGVVLILVAAGIWILLCVDRGLLQAHREYRALAVNLLVEGMVRTALVIGFVEAGMGVSGYALGIFISEVLAVGQARWSASRAWPAHMPVPAVPVVPPVPTPGPIAAEVERKVLIADVSAAFVGLALLGLLQNVDVILLGRLNHAESGSYAAISVASKALVFGALALGAYLLPEATIRWNQGGHAVRQLVVTLVFLAVPAVVLLGIALVVPTWFLSLIFTPKLATSAPAFASLVGAMIFLCISVLLTNYLFGAGRRWIVLLLVAGSGLAIGLVAAAHGQPLATARADLVVQALLAAAMGTAFVVVHYRQHGERWRQNEQFRGVMQKLRRAEVS